LSFKDARSVSWYPYYESQNLQNEYVLVLNELILQNELQMFVTIVFLTKKVKHNNNNNKTINPSNPHQSRESNPGPRSRIAVWKILSLKRYRRSIFKPFTRNNTTIHLYIVYASLVFWTQCYSHRPCEQLVQRCFLNYFSPKCMEIGNSKLYNISVYWPT